MNLDVYDTTVDIVLNVYNEEKNITNFLDSLLANTHQNFRVILVDDGSTDHTVTIAKSYSDTINIQIVNTSHVGLRAARELGIQSVQTEIFLILDADLILSPDCIKEFIRPFNNKSVGAVRGRYTSTNQDGWITRGSALLTLAVQNVFIATNGQAETIPGGISAYRTVAVKDAGGFVAQDEVAEDLEIAWALKKKGWKLASTQNPIATHRDPDTWLKVVRWGYNQGRIGAFSRLRPGNMTELFKWHVGVRFAPLGLLFLILFRWRVGLTLLLGSLIAFRSYLWHKKIKTSIFSLDVLFSWLVLLTKSFGWCGGFFVGVWNYLKLAMR